MSKEQVSKFLRWLLKTVLMIVGFWIIIMPFIPAFKEYMFDAPEKEFGTKEVFISVFGTLLFTGGIFSNSIADAAKSRISKILNK